MTLNSQEFEVEVDDEPDERAERRPRKLAVSVTGASDGHPVFLLHGTPGSRRGPKPRSIVLYRLGVKLICYDRPGYGGSDRREGRTVADAAGDVAAIASRIGIDRYAVVGRSGGAPHALAVAASNEKVSSVATLVSLAPYDTVKLNWYRGMNPQNVREYTSADADTEALLANLTRWAGEARQDPQRMIEMLRAELSQFDHRVINDVALRRLLNESYGEGLRNGPEGWIDDVLAFRRPWKFQLSEIRCRALLWHGEDDRFSPVFHTESLHEQLTGTEDKTLVIQPDIGHFGAVEVLPEILSWIVDGLHRPDENGRPSPDEPVRRDPAGRSPGRAGDLTGVL